MTRVSRPTMPDGGPGPSRTAVSGIRAWASAARAAILATSDGCALLLSGTLAFLLWAQPVRDQDPGLYLAATPLLALVLLGYAQAGLYPGFGLGPVETLRRYSLTTIGAFIAFGALTFALKTPDIYSRVTVTLAAGISLILVPLLRHFVVRLTRGRAWWPEPVVFVTDARRPELMRRMLEERPAGEFTPLAEIIVSSEAEDGEPSAAQLLEHHARTGIRVAFADVKGPRAEATLERLRLTFPRVIMLRDFEELPVEGVQVRTLGGVLGLEYSNNLLRRQARWVKRATDLALAAASLLFAIPVTLAAMLLVRLVSHGPALFVQVREGRGGNTIYVPKIRTMLPDAEERMEEYLATHPGWRAQWEANFKLRGDPRIIPRIGHFLRRFSIDELPQLWSVIRGDMSLVGPRPFPPYHLRALSDETRQLRGQVRPGITGLWQVTARGAAGIEAQQAYDIYYIRNWSLWLDFYILARTAWVVVSGKGAY